MTRRSAPREWLVTVGDEQTRAVLDPTSTPESNGLLVLAHGAGGHKDDRGMEAAASLLRGCGLDVLRFNFIYRERGSRRPDPMPRLMQCMAAVTSRAVEETSPRRLILGGRSMGGRAGSMLAADGFACDALLLLAYPLHPAGQPEKLRDAHLNRIRVPVLCFNGTRDSLCRRDKMESVLHDLNGRWTMHWLEGADHGFHVLQSSGRTDGDILEEIAGATKDWLKDL
ncbi:MAG TPA: alpha/beta family hydrolase, partial [Anaerolineales bacterium]|nr:alpha/beta family hydrolase [Anaerolineales bacterium]